MTLRALMTLSPLAVQKRIRRWLLRREIKSIEIHLDMIERQRQNDNHVARVLVCRRLNLKSQLLDL